MSCFNFRIEAANKCRQLGDDGSGFELPDDCGSSSECSSLRRSRDYGLADVGASDGVEGIRHLRQYRTSTSTPVDYRLSATTSTRLLHAPDDLEVVVETTPLGPPASAWTMAANQSSLSSTTPTNSSLQPPSILKSSVKKEVKFCLDVSDDEGLRRPLNVVYHKASPTLDNIFYKVHIRPCEVAFAASKPVPVYQQYDF
jgi:hypothetical protein